MYVHPHARKQAITVLQTRRFVAHRNANMFVTHRVVGVLRPSLLYVYLGLTML